MPVDSTLNCSSHRDLFFSIEGIRWELATGGTGLSGCVRRISDYSARNAGPANEAFISGDTPLKSGIHAWRVKVDGLGSEGSDSVLGIVQAGRSLSSDSYEDLTLYAVDTLKQGYRRTAGKHTQDSGLGTIRNGDKVDFVLDIDNRTLTAITLNDGKRCVFNLPEIPSGWVPHFHLYTVGNQVSIELISPEEAGKL